MSEQTPTPDHPRPRLIPLREVIIDLRGPKAPLRARLTLLRLAADPKFLYGQILVPVEERPHWQVVAAIAQEPLEAYAYEPPPPEEPSAAELLERQRDQEDPGPEQP